MSYPSVEPSRALTHSRTRSAGCCTVLSVLGVIFLVCIGIAFDANVSLPLSTEPQARADGPPAGRGVHGQHQVVRAQLLA